MASDDPATALALALQIFEGGDDLPFVPEAEQAAYRALGALPRVSPIPDFLAGSPVEASHVAFGPRGERLVAGGVDGRVVVWSASCQYARV